LYEFYFTINSDFDRPERKGHGAKVPGSEMARERKGQGANRPESYWPIRSGERIGPGTKRLGTSQMILAWVSTGFRRITPTITTDMRTCGSADFLDLKMTKPNYKITLALTLILMLTLTLNKP